ncbi:MAG: sigma-54-dependent Fis family transcriptional regulator [Pontiellaceae bacterium]|nr:sigma-54-dependent Fis family transcriptional regulator [Pontiellaceae bacterium]MBN2785277.1 sigma-54-dependent Fis family transcriptional regulator [Pontiellaceae bacterium]
MKRRFIMLEPDNVSLDLLADAVRNACRQPCEIERLRSPEKLIEKLSGGLPWDMIMIDYAAGSETCTGSLLIRKIRKTSRDIPLIVTAIKGDVEIASEAIEAGATDFMVRSGRLADRVHTLMEKLSPQLTLIDRNRMLQEQNALLREAAVHRFQIVGESPQIQAVLSQIERVAGIPRPVLITGERGTGKELVARAIHLAGGNPGRPLTSVNCAAFSDHLLESELFGHEKGSFTGADSRVSGKFEQAQGGTLFLDEIGNMSLSFQQKILRVVEYGTFTRVGGSEEISVNTRIIAATNTDLKQRMQDGLFLRDLYDRLSFEIIEVPAIRNRDGDIPILARHFLHQFMQEIPSLQGKRLSSAAIRMLEKYAFPGNIRELKNLIERAAYRDTTNEITPEDIGLLPREPVMIDGGNFVEKVESYKRQLLLEALDEATGNQAKAARILGLSYHQYRYFLKKHS